MFASGLAFPPLFLLATPQTRAVMNRLYRSAQHAFPDAVRYSSVQAGLGLKKIQDLPGRIEARHRRAMQYQSLFRTDIRMQRLGEGAVSTWYFLVAVLPVAAAPVRRRLLMRGIDAGVEGEIADNCARLLGRTDCPGVDEVFPRAIALPIFDGITEGQVERVARALNRSF
jgi:dTDP-4-amino-4,6-dideoxygalactose transaminase